MRWSRGWGSDGTGQDERKGQCWSAENENELASEGEEVVVVFDVKDY